MGVGRLGRLAPALAILVVALTSCGLGGFGQARDAPAPAAPEPIGPIVETGRGQDAGFAWGYSIYESTVGVCTQLEMTGGMSGESCGGGIGMRPGPDKLTVAGVGSGGDTPVQIEGFATEDVAALWIETDDAPVAAALMVLEGLFELEGQAWLAFVPPGREVGDAVARDAAGNEIGREVVDVPFQP